MDDDIELLGPLSFDKIMEGKAVAAYNSPLFAIPIETLNQIISYLVTDEETLASLAFVNSDCRQPARSCQFRIVEFDFSLRSESILDVLEKEAIERIENNGLTRSPALGSCIRRLVVNQKGFTARVSAYCEGKKHYPEQRYNFGCQLSDTLVDFYYPKIPSTMPSLVHLEGLNATCHCLYRRGVYLWSVSLFQQLSSNSVRHLSLNGMVLKDNFAMNDFARWSLQTLYLKNSHVHFVPHILATLTA